MQSIVEAQAQSGVMDRLREATSNQHRHAESRPLQKMMANGTVSRELFAAYLGQMLLVHQDLEAALDRAQSEEPRIGEVYQSWQQRTESLRTDLEFYGVELASIESLPAAASLIDAIHETERTEPLSLLGMLYVLEGSTNGSKYIARALSRAFGIEYGSGPGLAYLNPYGEEQPERWQTFKCDMGGVKLAPVECDGIVNSAKVMFEAIAAISEELLPQPSAV